MSLFVFGKSISTSLQVILKSKYQFHFLLPNFSFVYFKLISLNVSEALIRQMRMAWFMLYSNIKPAIHTKNSTIIRD